MSTSEIKEILAHTKHRPFKLPEGRWAYYQEWNKALFLHWIAPYEALRKHVPAPLKIDTFNGNCYISLVAFTMEKIRPRHLPALSFISDFDEINIRTYIDNDHKKGVYFLSIEAGKSRSALIANILSGLPYEKAAIKRTNTTYQAQNEKRKFSLNTKFITEKPLIRKTEHDKWLTERYCLYLEDHSQLYRYDIHHKAWPLRAVTLQNTSVNYKLGQIRLSAETIAGAHYSEGVKVVAWPRKTL